MLFDTVTIGCSVALIILALLSACVFNVFRRRLRADVDMTDPEEWPSFTVVMAVHNQAEAIERNLPVILSQDYPGRFDVVVVNESSTDDTEDVLKRLKQFNKHLYVTYIPESSHYISRRKLSLTLGVKAARGEWVVFTSPDACPESDEWLRTLARHATADRNIVVGYTAYDAAAATLLQRFQRIVTSIYQLSRALGTMAYAYTGRNMAFRKSVFMSHNGFLKNLKYLRGEYEFIVNEYAEPDSVAVALEPEARIVEDAPTPKRWKDENICYMETRRHLDRSLSYRTAANVDTALMMVNALAEAAALVWGALTLNYILLGAAAVAVILTLVLRMVMARRGMKRLGEKLPAWRIPLLETALQFKRFDWLLRHRFSDRYDFIRK